MEAAGFNPKTISKGRSITQALLFIVPSLVITVISYVLFALLKNFTAAQLNEFSVTTMAAIVVSLVGTAGMQLLIYRIIDNGKSYKKDEAAGRGIRLGIIYSLAFSVVVAALFYPYFQNVLHFSITTFSYFAVLLILYSLTWILTAAFWATGQYKYPAVVFTFSYLAILSLSYGFHQVDPVNTLSGYTIGVSLLLGLSVASSRMIFGKARGTQRLSEELSTTLKLIPKNISLIFFQIFCVLAIFLDKIIVWVSEGLKSGDGLLVVGPYTIGAFLGLVPVFGVAAVVYFANRAGPLVENMYKGTFSDIQRRIKKYKYLYGNGLMAMLVIGCSLFILAGVFCFYFFNDPLIFKIWVTTSLGAIFFMGIVYNSIVLPLFGKTNISTVAILLVCIGESLSIFFVANDVWAASVGFLSGSFIGFLISFVCVRRLFSEFEYHVFRPLTVAI